jgi:hypothetical protein
MLKYSSKTLMNKLIHGLIAAFFAFACLCLWAMLNLTEHIMFRVTENPPGFTQFCIGLKPLFVVLPILAVAYCIYVWIRKADTRRSWISFFAATMGSLVVVMLPTLLAVLLPVIQFMELTVKK